MEESKCSYTISSTPVNYPHKAYPSQISMIDRVIKALQRNQNCLIESPTGSGKSLALLCAVLAWRKNEYDRIVKEINESSRTTDQSVSSSVFERRPEESLPSSTTDSSPGVPLLVDLTFDEEDYFKDSDDAVVFKDSPLSNRLVSPKKSSRSIDDDSSQASSDHSKPLTEDEIQEKIYQARKRIPKIYFGTRTHKQLAQLIRELKKTKYADVKMTILAGRDQTCINETVRRQKDRGEECRKLLNPQTNYMTGTCPYHAKWKKTYQKPYAIRNEIRRAQNARQPQTVPSPDEEIFETKAWDIEDLVELGRAHGFCPYFAATNTLITDAELIFCPYNYLIDPLVRNSVRLELKDQIILLDEAHNIEDVCREASSFTFTHDELHDATDQFTCAASMDNYPPAKATDYLAKVCTRLYKWMEEAIKDKALMKFPSQHNVQMREWQGQQFIDVLVQLQLTKETGVEIKAKLDEISSFGEEEREGRRAGGRNTLDDEPSNISSGALKAMEKMVLFLDYFWKTDAFDYRICLQEEYGSQKRPHASMSRSHQPSQLDRFFDRQTQPGTVAIHNRRESGQNNSSVTLNLWCMNPAMAFGDIKVAKSVILASGTLAPMNTFQTELSAQFSLQLEATHILPKDRMFVASVSKGPNGLPLRVTHQHTSEWTFQDELGRVLLDVCSRVPHGVLCFFPSYKLLDTLYERWRNGGILTRLSAIKHIVLEPKISGDLTQAMNEFYDAVSHPPDECTGALFLAVCRGKVSEGLDFADNNARAVVTIGIPYPNFTGFEVQQKREYNNERVRRKQSTLDGDQWYEIQAYRALNQALGRCLRHRRDWGSLILVDARFSSGDGKRYCAHLSRWIRENIRHYDNFGKMTTDLGSFTQRLLDQEEVSSNLQF